MKTSLTRIALTLVLLLIGGCAPITVPSIAVDTPPPNTLAPTSSPSPTPADTGAAATTTSQTVQSNLGTNSLGKDSLGEIRFSDTGYTDLGEWAADVVVSSSEWQPGSPLKIQATLRVTDPHFAALALPNVKPDSFVMLATAERTFDADGWLRLASDEYMSTLVTPTGLGIEGGVQGAVTKRFGYGFQTPVDEFVSVPMTATTHANGERQATFTVQTKLPDDLPPGIYRLRLDFGVAANKRYANLNMQAFTRRGFPQGKPIASHLYSPPLRADGKQVSGKSVDASKIQPRIPWVILGNYNSNGYRGVVAAEDEPHFALSTRNIIPDQVILPLYDDNNKPVSYSLEPQFPADIIDPPSNITWDNAKGELSIQVTDPNGKTTDLGTAPFVGQAGQWPTTRKPAMTAWKPPAYGQYTVKATGWIADIWGNRYEGGGTYRFWIAKRMTLATATFQGQAYPVGNRYGRDIGFSPAVPANVTVTATLYVNSDPKNARTVTYSGQATPSGIFGAAQGMKPLPFDAPGEYHAEVLATYKDADGHLWVSTMRHAGVIYPEDSPIVAHGKKLLADKKLVDRGETKDEGWADRGTDSVHLQHINYPYLSGDVLLIASEQEGANKIEPVLTYELKSNPAPYDPALQIIGATNVRLQTSNGYSPHLFPEYITDWAYYYAGAPRPGFMSRFLVGEDGVRAPYWPTSPNRFGGQINASNNGDLPGDIYRLLGGVVVLKKGQAPMYAGYLSSAFILPKGTNNNRVVTAGSEDLLGSNGSKARFFLTGTRPGMLYETGTSFAPAVQIDPILPVNITFTLYSPDGRQTVWQGTGDSFGTFAGKDRVTLDVPGIYRFTLEGEWNGYKGYMPGLSKDGGEVYVVEKDRPANAPGLVLNLPTQSKFPPNAGVKITGKSTAETIHYAAVIPGAAVLQGTAPVKRGAFEYFFDPKAINKMTPTYDTVNLVNGRPEIGDVVHLSFFSQEKAPDGTPYHSFVRLIIRGNTVLYVR